MAASTGTKSYSREADEKHSLHLGGNEMPKNEAVKSFLSICYK